MLRTGTNDISSLIAVENLSIIDYGLERINDTLQADRAAHNALVDGMLADLAERTTQRGLVYGASAQGEMVELDEYGRAPTQRGAPGAPLDIPMKKYGYAIGWTYQYFLTKTPADIARAQLAAQAADLVQVQTDIKRALFGATNYSVRDRLVDNYTLNVKRLVNADSQPIPNGPNAEVYDGASHTHYDASATLTTTALDNLINDVVEHGHGAGVRLYINKGNETAVRALTGFYPVQPGNIVPADNVARAVGELDTTRLDNRRIGVYGAADVWVKPWVPLNYYFAFSAADARKPLAFREPVNAALRGLRTVATLETHPMYSDNMEHWFGVGVRTRTNGAILFVDAGGVYVTPTF